MLKSERLTGLVLGEAGVPCARLIARMLAQGGGDIPDTPAATSYLYGRVAAEGETPDVIIDGVGYVGAVLPALPEWDKSVYPYAYIAFTSGWFERYHLVFTSDPYYATSTSGDYCIGYREGDIVHICTAPVTDFGEGTEQTSTGVYVSVNSVVWANFDVLNEDGAVIVAKSDPIPVYEKE